MAVERLPGKLVILLTAGLILAGGVRAQQALAPEKGRFLVAREDLGDPNFYRTVVLLLDYSEKGAMGVIVNRPSAVLMRDLLPKLEDFASEREEVFLGGPVERDGVVLVVRHGSAPEGFHHVAGDLYTGANLDGLLAMADGGGPQQVRAYAGYSGWGPGQLDREIEQGAWLIARATSAQVFDPNPQALWRKLFDASQVRFARLWPDALLH